VTFQDATSMQECLKKKAYLSRVSFLVFIGEVHCMRNYNAIVMFEGFCPFLGSKEI
jgi:hypothetical protein